MGVFRKGFLTILLLAAASFSYAEEAEKTSFITPSPEKIARLDQWHARADALMAENKFREAVGAYTEIILLEADDESAYANLGRAHMILGEREKAAEAFRNALEINPDNPMALMGLRRIADPDASIE